MGVHRPLRSVRVLDPDAPAPPDIFDEFLEDDDEQEDIAKALPAPGAPSERCGCDWTWHRGHPCRNAVPVPLGVLTSPQLCTPCLYSCEIEREEAAGRTERRP
jgi:hypothetical protein